MVCIALVFHFLIRPLNCFATSLTVAQIITADRWSGGFRRFAATDSAICSLRIELASFSHRIGHGAYLETDSNIHCHGLSCCQSRSPHALTVSPSRRPDKGFSMTTRSTSMEKKQTGGKRERGIRAVEFLMRMRNPNSRTLNQVMYSGIGDLITTGAFASGPREGAISNCLLTGATTVAGTRWRRPMAETRRKDGKRSGHCPPGIAIAS